MTAYMNRRDELEQGLKELIEDGKTLNNSVRKIKIGFDIGKFRTDYQIWYTRALKIVEILASNRLTEFVSYYKNEQNRKVITARNYVIRDFIMGFNDEDSYGKISRVTSSRITNQVQILISLESCIDSVFADIQGSLLSELQDRELATAEELLRISVRAAGSLAGVILENHLQKVAQDHKINVTQKNPTISELNDPLKNCGIYGVPVWRKIQYLGDIRNLCSHKKDSEPTDEQVKELISGVNEIIKKVF